MESVHFITGLALTVGLFLAAALAQLTQGVNHMSETLDSIKTKLDTVVASVTSKLAELKQAIDDEAAVIAAAGGDATKLQAIGDELSALNVAVGAVSATPDAPPVTPPAV